jgi:hypothetical protein
VLGACWSYILDAILRNIVRVEEMHSKGAFVIGLRSEGSFNIDVCCKSAFCGE